MWYASSMPAVLPVHLIETAEAAVANAQNVRRFHGRRTQKGSKQREKDIALALKRLREAMDPVRSAIGKFQYGPQTETAEANRQRIREASRTLQQERRKLWKMRAVKEKK
jgi:hypothetical protein